MRGLHSIVSIATDCVHFTDKQTPGSTGKGVHQLRQILSTGMHIEYKSRWEEGVLFDHITI